MVKKFVAILRQFEIRFHLTGGLTTIYYGEPRLTQDIYVVVDNHQVAAVLDAFLEVIESSDFIFDADSIREAIADQGMFQLLDAEESLKLEIYPRELIPEELDRLVLESVFEGEKMSRITDFGLAKQVEADSELTSTGQIMGTPSYMPPEQETADATPTSS